MPENSLVEVVANLPSSLRKNLPSASDKVHVGLGLPEKISNSTSTFSDIAFSPSDVANAAGVVLADCDKKLHVARRNAENTVHELNPFQCPIPSFCIIRITPPRCLLTLLPSQSPPCGRV